ncbi:heme exporter protein CcmD [Stenotrophomonas sp. STM01]|uniref:heme exporter protein CcmD n=1 Tax=Stenotrophomonas sp. STM01 TaxID=2769278 RepID=UPI00177D3E3D|nr:heme exporter protein CcmD [Stenotrophomonas sp. STM01]MBD9534553.1 heme exporter protein CcmD [Stenotrophomonas sp. STM01]
MTYFKYVAMAYAVFFIVLAWDFIVPRLQIRRQLRQARSRVARARQATQVAVDEELSR